MLSLSRSPAVGPCGIPAELDAGVEVVDAELVAGAGDEELVADVEELEPEPQPATNSAIATSAALSSRRPDLDFVALIARPPVVGVLEVLDVSVAVAGPAAVIAVPVAGGGALGDSTGGSRRRRRNRRGRCRRRGCRGRSWRRLGLGRLHGSWARGRGRRSHEEHRPASHRTVVGERDQEVVAAGGEAAKGEMARSTTRSSAIQYVQKHARATRGRAAQYDVDRHCLTGVRTRSRGPNVQVWSRRPSRRRGRRWGSRTRRGGARRARAAASRRERNRQRTAHHCSGRSSSHDNFHLNRRLSHRSV